MEERLFSTDIAILKTPEPEIRFTSGKTIYVEKLVGDRWVSRYWAADGRINYPGEQSTEDAFQVEINQQLLSNGWQWVSEFAEQKTDVRHSVVELKNNIRPIAVKIHTLLDGTPVLTRWLEITNTSDKSRFAGSRESGPVALTAISPWSGMLWPSGQQLRIKDQAFTLGYFTKFDWAYEGWFDWKPLESGTTLIKCDKGQGHDDPFFIVRNEAKGEYFICHLAWSANWHIQFECKQDSPNTSSSLLFKIGPSAASPQRVIAPGETIQTPAVHLGHVEGDLDTTVQAMHDHLRRFVLPTRKKERSYLIQLLVPGDQGYLTIHTEDDKTYQFNETNIKKALDVTAAVGAELFTLDAWWWDVSGDWYPSASRFPHGIELVREYAHEKGLLFGLYVEMEGGRGPMGESQISKEHPDWLGPKGILNLTKPEVAAWMESEICRIIDEYKPDLYRLDYNPGFTFEGPETPRDGFMENNYWRYYEALYGIYERIQKKYPDLILQQCAAGGARNDLGIASRFHETYLTDGLWMPHVLRVYSGQTLALPPETLVIAIGAPGWKGPLDTYLRSTFTLSTPLIAFGPAPSLEELNPQHQERFRHYVKIYKEFIRPLLPTCKMYHHAPVSSRGGVESSSWFAMEYASPDSIKGWTTIVRIGESESDSFLFMPRGLDPGRTYKVTFDSIGKTATIDGWRLMCEGLSIRLEAVMSSELLLFEAQ